MESIKALRDIGLEDKEARLYASLLEAGETTVLKLSQRSGIKRPTAYVVLEALEKKGFAMRAVRGGKTFFIAQPPKKLISEAEFRLQELREVVPQLESLLQKGSGKPRVMIYDSKEALDRAYDEVFIIKGELLYIGNLKLFQEAFPRTMKKFHYVTYSPAFTVRGILETSEEARSYVKEFDNDYQHTRFMPRGSVPFNMDIGIFGNRTLLSSIKKDYFTVSIESDDVADAFRVIFEIMWRSAEQ